MAAIVREGLEAGAIGFSTSRTQLHRTRDGEVMPGTYADEAELLGIGKVLGETGKGVYQLVSDWDEWEKEMDWMKRLSISTGRPVGFVLFYRADEEWERVQRQLEYVRQANAEGAQLVPHVGARPVTILMAFDGTAHPFMFHQAFQPLAGLPAAERLAKLRDPAVRAAMLAETPPSLGHPIADRLAVEFDNMYPLEDDPSYEPRAEDSIAAQAARRGVCARRARLRPPARERRQAHVLFPGLRLPDARPQPPAQHAAGPERDPQPLGRRGPLRRAVRREHAHLHAVVLRARPRARRAAGAGTGGAPADAEDRALGGPAGSRCARSPA